MPPECEQPRWEQIPNRILEVPYKAATVSACFDSVGLVFMFNEQDSPPESPRKSLASAAADCHESKTAASNPPSGVGLCTDALSSHAAVSEDEEGA